MIQGGDPTSFGFRAKATYNEAKVRVRNYNNKAAQSPMYQNNAYLKNLRFSGAHQRTFGGGVALGMLAASQAGRSIESFKYGEIGKGVMSAAVAGAAGYGAYRMTTLNPSFMSGSKDVGMQLLLKNQGSKHALGAAQRGAGTALHSFFGGTLSERIAAGVKRVV
jgi:hypothetical protein